MVYTPSDSCTDGSNSLASLTDLQSSLPLSTSAANFPLNIPFNNPLITGRELEYMRQVLVSKRTSGDGVFTKQCQTWLTQQIGSKMALMTHSCTAALEMAALLADLQPGDEVIMPSYTFVSTANAFVLRGAVPVFVDIRPDTLNLDEAQVEAAITPRTKVIAPVHYAGVSCEMDSLMAIAHQHRLLVVEDAAQGILAHYKNRPVGSMGHLAAFSFHETKNIISGEGGALMINDSALLERAEIIREKGTNRSQFFRGEVDKYTWVDIGSSYLPSDILCAFLLAQLEQGDCIIQQRMEIWNYYHQAFAALEQQGTVRRPIIPTDCQHNAHIYYLLTESLEVRTALMTYLKQQGIQSTFHYVPLHSAPAGLKYGRVAGQLAVTDDLSNRLVRLPLGAAMTMSEAARVVEAVLEFLG
ncbi:MAG: dTDP-4-amino-4,6-dideoxygalactose transaminase [Pegethrix bostrychoides GSE-TBD4-15B]|jgi:dTDP-4-amino-4,6-dideoxygalactose transaminase|uniref:dTDP-4-amino-4,6-dideoxygalactose transaminase n=1 Tax=Pegethrix bostrychoides GSE-TBD4-15B TaxID=2839662 RepID=A0A951U6Y2_9CYAN|nr:dTDP-4-amino-4,6-dideoxygalactose transaminase [Pegethrix bostrychoides GSE-TBD4-15B]